MMKKCPFCELPPNRIFYESKLVVGLWDRFPVARGHALLVPRRHFAEWFSASEAEHRALVEAIASARDAILAEHQPDGFNIGVNIGEAAGQTVPHLHVHVIPRYRGDVPDPTGGVRFVIPHKANYLLGSPSVASEVVSPVVSPLAAPVASSGDRLVRVDDEPLLPILKDCFDRSASVDIAVAFVKDSGVRRLYEHLRDLLARGGRLRLLTGDYLDITDPSALMRLCDLDGDLQLRVYEARKRGFHPKSYIFENRDGSHVAFVGSSNLSEAALADSVEWNYQVVGDGSPGFASIREGFESLFADPATVPVTSHWVNEYQQRRRPQTSPGIEADAPVELPLALPEPYGIQQEALDRLCATREAGNRAGLVVLATGLGKTWLSAFDTASDLDAFGRILFVAHREEILNQAIATYRRIRPSATIGRYTGVEKTPEADILFASIQTLGKTQQLSNFGPTEFDYIVIDEFHHAAARTYRQLITHFEPRFLLGLTATPERADGGDLMTLCENNLVYSCNLARGINEGLLSPFHYYGVPDEVDYTNIPWRSSRFDEEALTNAVATQARAENALEQLRQRGGQRTLAFCCSQRHADFMADYFTEAGLKAVAVHTGAQSAPRASSLEQLEEGKLDVVCAVDMFNEGLDVPLIDTVMMLRPTESRVIWQQQFGRGLRRAEGKDRLTVIDYIGNHRSFLLKPQTLLDLHGSDEQLRRALQALMERSHELPKGCEVTYELEAVDILQSLLRQPRGGQAVQYFYEDFRERHGHRPRAAEVAQEGYNPGVVRKSYGSWFRFVEAMEDLSPREIEALDAAERFLETLEITPMTRSLKMLLVLAMLNEDAFPGSIDIEQLAVAFARRAARSACLAKDVGPSLADIQELQRHLEKNPIAAWTGGKGTKGTAYFAYEDGVLTTKLPIPNDGYPYRPEFQELVRELTEWRLSVYVDRLHNDLSDESRVLCGVIHTKGRPILRLPDRAEHPGVPYGWTDLTANGKPYRANFVKIAVNVIRTAEPGAGAASKENALPGLVRGWYGPDAGAPGTRFYVAFEKTEAGWELKPAGVGQTDIELRTGE